MIFFLPLVVSLGAVAYFWFLTDMNVKWKLLAAAMVALSIYFQFVAPTKMHFLVPMLLQTFVAFWMIFHQKMN